MRFRFWGSAWTIHSFMQGDFFNEPISSVHSFGGGLYETNNYFIQISYLFGRPFLCICFLRAFYLFNYSNCSDPSLEVVHLFLSQKEWQSSICWSVLCPFHSLYYCHLLPLIQSLSFNVTRFHSLSVDVPLTCLFINDHSVLRKFTIT